MPYSNSISRYSILWTSPARRRRSQGHSRWKHGQPRSLFVSSHDRVMACHTYQPAFLTIVRTAVYMILNIFWQRKLLAYSSKIEVTIEIDPLAAVHRPGPSAERLLNSTGMDCL